ncbi:isoflavone reductase family protein [Ampelomyces quisqualis]|uniref:Isoflavone reductase family protein n=1 Tax=Ampelomyces quisqualis TaxID=50730 RepID=A0A6A5QQW4_AMPQU|nr:isoflavone reductase family protein [Ampelomyces quisqualis]
MSDFKNVIIIGAGGNLGPAILDSFLKDSSFNTTVLSREGSSSTFPPGTKVIHADYDSPDSLKSALKGQDVVVSLVASSVIGEQLKFVDAAIAAGVQRFLPSEFGSDTADSRTHFIPFSKAKYDIVKYLKSKESQLSWTSVITGPFFDWCTKVGFNGLNYAEKTATLYDGGKAKFSATNLRTVGLAVVKALEKPELTKNQYVYVSGLETSQKEILAVAEQITGTKWTVTHESTKDLAEGGKAKLQKGDGSGILALLLAVTFGAEEQLGYVDPAKLWNDKLGVPKDDVEKSVRAAFGL